MSMITIRAVVLGTDELDARRRGTGAMFTRTPLDMLQVLERAEETIEVIVLAGEFARRDDIARFLRDSYPQIPVNCNEDATHAAYARAS